MQPSPPSPPAAPAADAPTFRVVLPGGPVSLEGLPQTAQELQGLRARREVLRDQLERASNRRAQLVGQLNGGLADEARAGVQQRLAVLDERIIQLERDQAATERLLSHASPRVLALATEPPPHHSMVDEDDAVLGAVGAFGFGVVLTLLVGRLRRRLVGRRAAAVPAAAMLPDDPRLERLSQAVDAIAEEVERIGEGQRFVTQLLANRREAATLHAEPAERR